MDGKSTQYQSNMIQDYQTNMIYLAQGLNHYAPFCRNLLEALRKEQIHTKFLPHTSSHKHIWVRDYMPIQLEKDLFLKYQYAPDYLKGYPAYMPDYHRICEDIGLKCITTDIVLDGGNVIKCGGKVIMTDKIFKENPGYKRKDLIEALENLLQAELIIIPWDKYEMYGHADGMVRYIDGNRVLLNNYINFDPSLRKKLLDILKLHFEVEELNYKTVCSSKFSWVSINYLQIKNSIFVPWLPILENKEAESQFNDLFQGYKIWLIEGVEDVAREGGALNCISWNILGDI